VLGGLGLALWAAWRGGLYETIALFVNLLAAVYLSLFATPTLVAMVPAAADIPFGGLISALAVAGVTFVVLHVLCFAMLTGQFRVAFPEVLDKAMAAALGFVAGFLAVAFLTTLVTLAPKSKVPVSITDNDRKVHVSYVCWWCDRIHSVVGSTATAHPTLDRLEQLRQLDTGQQDPGTSEPNAPAVGHLPKALP
jgi:hypothetical protein